MVRNGLETNCQACPFRTYDGVDHVCNAHFDGLPGHPVVYPSMYKHPDWCPLETPQRVTREEVENAMHPTVRAAVVSMYVKNGSPVPERLNVQIEHGGAIPRGDR